MTETMRAIVLDAPGPPDALTIRELPVPTPAAGWVLIEVKAFGLNRSELHTRQGLASDVTFPRVLGVEAAGVVAQCPGGELSVGQQVVTMMGGMGRTFDGGYAEYTCVPASQVIPLASDLEWSTIGAVPEMLQTAYGSLTVGLDAQPGQSILIRGGTSSVGMAAAVLAKRRRMTVLSTTRSPKKGTALKDVGVDHVLIDDGEVARQVHELLPSGVDTALELVGTPTLPDTLHSTRLHGVVCFTGMLSNVWTVRDFYPIEYLPRGVRLTAYHGEAEDLPHPALQDFLNAVADGVAVEDGRTVWSGPPVAPLGKRDQRWRELTTLFGQQVFVQLGLLGVLVPSHDPGNDETVKAVSEDVGRDPESALKVAVAGRTGEEGVADDEQAPALAHH